MYNLYELSNAIGNKLETLCELFNISYRPSYKYAQFPCPLHQGVKDSLTIFLQPRGDMIYNWRCWTGNCHEIYGKSIISLVYGLLKQKDTNITRKEALDWCYNFTGLEPTLLKLESSTEKQQWVFYNQIFNLEEKIDIPKEDIRSRLLTPSSYYINRGFTPEILTKYNVGTCLDKTKEMFMRVVFPLLDETGQYLIGCAGRSVNEKCPQCNLFHYKENECPIHPLKYLYFSKWKNSKNFIASKHFFNLWNSKDWINQSETVVLLEGPSDLLRLEEANIHNGLSLFGCNLSDSQQVILEQLNCKNLILSLDNDKAGESAIEKIVKKLERTYNIYKMKFSGKDIGELSIEEIQKSYQNIERLN